MKRNGLFFLLIGIVVAFPVAAQTPPRPLVTQPIEQSSLVALPGSVHPLARAGDDRGLVADSFPTGRIFLLLNRPPEQETALAEFLRGVHTPGSPTYHQWLTPDQFGAQFGPADSDVRQVSQWLAGSGFQVSAVSKGRTLIEFSGTAGQVRRAFHAEIHKFQVNGAMHYANATGLEIPAALAGIIRGVSSLNDFRPTPNLRVSGHGHFDPASRRILRDTTLTGNNGPFYAIAPEDFATQYDLTPLYAAGINGSGETIGVINDSNIDLSLDADYRSLFHLTSNAAQVVQDGGDPGVNGDAIEAYLDVELAGAVAPAATVNLYIASWDTSTAALDDPLILAARRAIDDNQADVLSVSFGECEAGLGVADNEILNNLWEQAAAQGQTVLVSTGDNGAAGCDNPNPPQVEALYGFQVNGFASTPWDVAVGGTDFFYSDYAGGAPSSATFWNAANDANLGSLKAPLPEQVWDDTLGFNAINPENTSPDLYWFGLVAGSGGASSCLNYASDPGGTAPFVCNYVAGSGSPGLKGYAKPSWQVGTGTPADGVRDLPDVSLFAADGNNYSAYAICASPGDCEPGANQQIPLTLVGGTSASAQAMAGIMALVDQKYGRQGQADYTLYALAQQKSSVFRDITRGGNEVPCYSVNGAIASPNCSFRDTTTWPGPYPVAALTGYAATAGYDLASGLGTVDANQLVTNWNTISFASTSTSLQISPTTFAHGASVNLTTSVDSSGGSTPQGAVDILSNSLLPASQSLGYLTLAGNGSASTTIDTLPGGTYQLWANYGGDASHSASESSPVSVTVSPEASTIVISAVESFGNLYNPAVGCTPVIGPNQATVASGSTVYPYTPLWLTARPTGSTSRLTTATGFVTFTFDGQPASVPLNVQGVATWITPMTASSGNHSVVASYAGDASYAASTSPPFTYTVQPNPVGFVISPFGLRTTPGDGPYGYGCGPGNNQCGAYAGDSLPVVVSILGAPCTFPNGTATLTLGTQTQTVTMTPVGYPTGQILIGYASFNNLQPGTYQLTGSYSGDSNFAPATATPYTVTVAAGPDPLPATTTTVSVTPSQISYENGSATFNVTVTSPSGAPTGYVYIYGDGTFMIWDVLLTPSGPNTSTASAEIRQNEYNNLFDTFTPYLGIVPVVAAYLGSTGYQGSVSAPVPLDVVPTTVTPDFLLAPQAGQVTVQAGGSTTLAINLASINEFNGSVALACTPSSSQISCSITPVSAALFGEATATLTIKAAAQTTALLQPVRQPHRRWPAGLAILAFPLLFLSRRRRRLFAGPVLLGLLLVAVFSVASCGGKSSSSSGGGGGGGGGGTITKVNSYSVVVTGTGSGIVHNAKVTVLVP